MKQDTTKLIVIFLAAILIYGVVVSFFTSTVHIGSDEELYLEMAKSFHYIGRFDFNGEPTTYNCVLYSILISFSYFFYSPEKILFLMRLIGVITMCSSIFPIWLIANRVLEDRNWALLFSAFTLCLPFMFESAYLMQEVLSYPLFLWTVYFLWRMNEYSYKNIRWILLSAVFSVACFFCKTHLFFIPIIVNFLFLIEFLHKKEIKSIIRKMLVYDGAYLLFTVILYLGILMINGFAKGSNRYVDQFSHLFPITWRTVLCAVTLSVTYVVLFALSTGVVPMVSLILNYNKFVERKKWFLYFTLASCFFMVFETVFLATIPEEGLQIFPHRFLLRYFQMLIPLVLLLFTKLCQDTREVISKKVWICAELTLFVCILYFVVMQGKTTQGIVDGFVFLILENFAHYFIPYGDVIVIIFAGVFLTLLWKVQNNIKRNGNKLLLKIGFALFGILWMINCVQLPVYNNIIAGGSIIQEDSIKIANYLNDGNYEFIYYIEPKNGERYPRNFYGYVKQSFQVIEEQNVDTVLDTQKKIAFLAVADQEIQDNDIQKVNLQTEKLNLYIPDT